MELPDSKTGFKQILLSDPALEILDDLNVVEGKHFHNRRGIFFTIRHLDFDSTLSIRI